MKFELKNRKKDKNFEPNSPIAHGEVFNDNSLTKENRLLNDKLTLNEIAEFLKVKSIRTVINWCKIKKLEILKFGKEKYVNLMDFHFVIDHSFIESLKTKYPNDWILIYSAYKKMDFETIAKFLTPNSALNIPTFKVKSKAASNFLNKLKLDSNE
ncbi:MAG: helix-turn-helix domain-containing protein [Crocinitomicaceae bacterium]|jgi:hypothetical protein